MKDSASKSSARPTRPDFIIIGTMKGGTTRLYDFLTMHPDVERASAKEIHYFSLYYDKGDEWYFDHFRTHPDTLTGEASPTYFHLAHSTTIPSLIKRINNKIKIILIVRDPVERAVSQYNHFCKVNKLPDVMSLDVSEFFGTPYNEILTRSTSLGFHVEQAIAFSLYYRNYLSYESIFDRNDILVLSMQNLRELPFDTMKAAYKFIGVPYVQHDEFKVVKYAHGTDMTKLNPQTFTRLAELFYPDYQKFCQRTGIPYSELDPSVMDPTSGGSRKFESSKSHTINTTAKNQSENTAVGTKSDTSTPDVHIGKDGWLFLLKGSNNSIDYYQDPDLFNSQLVDNWIKLLGRRVKYFTEKNIRYLHLFAPNKLTVYPERYDGELPFFAGSPLQKLHRIMVERGENEILDHVINPVSYFNKVKESHQLYWKTDTHWTFYGLFAAYQLLCSKLGVTSNADLLQRGTIKGNLVLDEGGKLNPPMSEEVVFFDLLKDAKRAYANELVKYKEENKLENTGMEFHVGSNVVFHNKTTSNHQKVIVFGDSFSEYRPNFLTGTLAETFREVHFVWSVNLDFKYIEKVKPDIVITEIVERFMPQVPTDTFDLEEYCRSKLGEKKPRDKFRQLLRSVKRAWFG